MKKRFMLLSLIFFTYCGAPNKQIAVINGNSYSLILLEPITNSPGCGILKVAVAMKFKFESESEDLVVLIPCPELLGENFFLKDHLYKIKLTADTTSLVGCLIINRYKESHLPTYYALKIEKSW